MRTNKEIELIKLGYTEYTLNMFYKSIGNNLYIYIYKNSETNYEYIGEIVNYNPFTFTNQRCSFKNINDLNDLMQYYHQMILDLATIRGIKNDK